jgi:hypothetical protein
MNEMRLKSPLMKLKEAPAEAPTIPEIANGKTKVCESEADFDILKLVLADADFEASN